MSKQVYISADYDLNNGDKEVVDVLNGWSNDNLHKIHFVDMAQVVSGSVSKDPDCRACDLKREINNQINASSAVIFIVGDKTSSRDAGSFCPRTKNEQFASECTPYKQNSNGLKKCKFFGLHSCDDDVGNVNNFSYLRHEFEQAKFKNKKIIIVYNSLRSESSWLPTYMKDYEDSARPFWKKNINGGKVGDYDFIKEALDFE